MRRPRGFAAEAQVHVAAGDPHPRRSPHRVVMVTASDTRVIDPEFAFYGPMAFDVGAILANLIMSYLAPPGHERVSGERSAFEAWVLETIEAVWTQFAGKFLALWRAGANGDAYPAVLFTGAAGQARLEAERR